MRRIRLAIASSAVTGALAAAVVIASLGSALVLRAQNPPQSEYKATVVGTVRDAVTRQPPKQSMVCTFTAAKPRNIACANVDSTGNYRLALPLHTHHRLSVSCSSVTGGMFLHGIYNDTVMAIRDTVPRRRDFVVATGTCDRRPVRRVSGVYAGLYAPAFEGSEFIPCADDAWFLPSDSLSAYSSDPRSAWLRFTGAAQSSLPKPWPRNKGARKTAYGTELFYVRARGTIVGPDRYGHMSGHVFEFIADSVLVVEPYTGQQECRALPPFVPLKPTVKASRGAG